MTRTRTRTNTTYNDYCLACDDFGKVVRFGHLTRGICPSCAGRLLRLSRKRELTNATKAVKEAMEARG